VQVGYNKLSELYKLAASSNDPHGIDFVGNMARAQVCCPSTVEGLHKSSRIPDSIFKHIRTVSFTTVDAYYYICVVGPIHLQARARACVRVRSCVCMPVCVRMRECMFLLHGVGTRVA
jgi:hypothetical protein